MDELPPGVVWNPKRRAFLEYLEQAHGFRKTSFRHEWRYPSLRLAIRYTRLFYGKPVALAVRRSNVSHVPECVGIWSLPASQYHDRGRR